MGAGQGITRLRDGISRVLTAHELEHGYFFVTRDVRIKEVLNKDSFVAEINGVLVPDRHLSPTGRMQIPVTILREIGPSRRVTIKLASRTKVTVKVDPT